MNKAITAAYNAAKQNNTDTVAIANLRALAVPKFKELYARVQKAARTVNRHLGEGKGTPNRATLATAIGLAAEFEAYKEIAVIIGDVNMEGAAATACNAIAEIAEMRRNKAYTRVAYIADYLTKEEADAEDVRQTRRYLANINRAVRRATDSINRHIVDGDYDPDTYKIAKVVGYADEVPELEARLNGLATSGLVTAADIDAAIVTFDGIKKVTSAYVAAAYTTPIDAIPTYDPFGDEITEDTDGGDGEVYECGE